VEHRRWIFLPMTSEISTCTVVQACFQRLPVYTTQMLSLERLVASGLWHYEIAAFVSRVVSGQPSGLSNVVPVLQSFSLQKGSLQRITSLSNGDPFTNKGHRNARVAGRVKLSVYFALEQVLYFCSGQGSAGASNGGGFPPTVWKEIPRLVTTINI
jgi:hypothetical protein